MQYNSIDETGKTELQDSVCFIFCHLTTDRPKLYTQFSKISRLTGISKFLNKINIFFIIRLNDKIKDSKQTLVVLFGCLTIFINDTIFHGQVRQHTDIIFASINSIAKFLFFKDTYAYKPNYTKQNGGKSKIT